MPRHHPRLLVLLLLAGCETTVDDLPATVPYSVVLDVPNEWPDDEPALTLLDTVEVVVEGRNLGRAAPNAEGEYQIDFEAAPKVDDPIEVALLVPTPCGIARHDSFTGGAFRTAEEFEVVLGRGNRMVEYRRLNSFGLRHLVWRHAYVDRGTSTATVRIGELTLPNESGEILIPTTNDCHAAPVTIDGETVGQWDDRQPLLVNLDPSVCHRYMRRAYSMIGLDRRNELDQLLTGRAAHSLDPGLPQYARIESYLTPFPQSVSSTTGAALLRGLARVECPEADAARGGTEPANRAATRTRTARTGGPARPPQMRRSVPTPPSVPTLPEGL